MKSFFLFAFLFPFLFAFSQTDNYLNEANTDLTQYFQKSSTVAENTLKNKYGNLTRSKGFTVLETTINGARFSRSLHESGKVIFESNGTKYLNRIKDYLLKEYPLINEAINIHIIEDNTLNAFATANNSIYVNSGLLAKIDNEAQLAYILCHEIMHIVNSHIIAEKLILKDSLKFSKTNLGDKEEFIQIYRHSLSRDNETEADIDGFQLFLKSKYDPEEAYRALMILSKANKFDSFISPSFFFVDSTEFDSINRFSLNIRDSVSEIDLRFRTHPLIEDRISQIRKLLKDRRLGGLEQYVLSKEDFDNLKNEATLKFQEFYANELDYINLYQLSASKYFLDKDHSKENINYLAYSLQGLIIDKLNNVNIKAVVQSKRNTLENFYSISNDFEFVSWCFNTLSKLNEKHKNEELTQYYKKNKNNLLMSLLSNKQKLELTGDSILHEQNNGLQFSDLVFEISPINELTPAQKRAFTETKGSIDRQGSIAVLRYDNVRINVKKPNLSGLSRRYVDYAAMEKTDFKTQKAFYNLSVDNPDNVAMLLPNDLKYNGDNYKRYKLLSNWMNVRLYNDGYDFQYVYQDKVDKIIEDQNIKYVMIGVDVETKSYSAYKFMGVYATLIPLYAYIPNQIANIVINSVRNYQLALIFELKNKDLVFWDKRTHLEPNSSEQFYVTFNNIIEKARLK